MPSVFANEVRPGDLILGFWHDSGNFVDFRSPALVLQNSDVGGGNRRVLALLNSQKENAPQVSTLSTVEALKYEIIR
jgi:hypothetical protein